MTSVKRFEVTIEYGEPTTYESDFGEFVLHADYSALETQLAEARAEISVMEAAMSQPEYEVAQAAGTFAQGIEAAVELHEQLWRETDAYKRERIRALSPTPQSEPTILTAMEEMARRVEEWRPLHGIKASVKITKVGIEIRAETTLGFHIVQTVFWHHLQKEKSPSLIFERSEQRLLKMISEIHQISTEQ